MRQDLIRIICDTKDVTNAVILTHNIDFVFFQSVVIPALAKCGSPALTIFADAECAAQTYQYQHHILSGLGSRYRVVSVAMKKGFVFHPKAVLLSGPETATLLVGSGNLTFGGWRENGEIWARYEVDTDGTAAFTCFRDYLKEVVGLCDDPNDTITTEVQEAFDSNTRTWASKMEPPGHLLKRVGQGESLLRQMKAVLAGHSVEHLLVCSPYFDEEAEALQRMARELDAPSSTVLVQNKRSGMLARAAAALGHDFTFKTTTFEHRTLVASEETEHNREMLLHAKFYAVQTADGVFVFCGSANCSRAALTVGGPRGNAELMTYAVFSKMEFQRQFLSELVLKDSVPEFAKEAEPQPSKNDRLIQIRAARMDGGLIRVTFVSDSDTTVTSALVDEILLEPVERGEGSLEFQTARQAGTLVLLGYRYGTEVRSRPHWIDDEYALRTSARRRSLGDSINRNIRGGAWNIGAWTEVLAELYKHLEYMPRDISRAVAQRHDREQEGGAVKYEWGDVFSDSYRLPVNRRFLAGFQTDPEQRIDGLRSMLLRWYGLSQSDSDDEAELGEEDSTPPDKDESVDEEHNVDRPKKLVTSIQRQQPPASERERRRALKLVSRIGSRLGEGEFLRVRPPELLAGDLKVVAVLLRVGLADEWITEEEFFDATLCIWSPLFFDFTDKGNAGWIEERYLTAPDREQFVKSVGSVELSAALACWALSTPDRAMSPKHVRFHLASTLSVSRLPWLWQAGGNEKIAQEVAELFARTTSKRQPNWKAVERQWLTLIRRGYALSCFERAIARLELDDLRGRIMQTKIEAGELLWQGRYRFCVATEDCNRIERQKTEVLVLQQSDTAKLFMSPFLTPVAGLLGEGVLDGRIFSSKARKELVTMMQNLRVNYSFGT